jgi:predicted nucleotidyltransferase
MPNMGTVRKKRRSNEPRTVGLLDALFGSTRQRVLGLLLGQPERRFALKELIALARSGTGAVQREVDRLATSGIVTTTSIDGRKYVQANQASPVFSELRTLIAKTVGIPGQLRAALEKCADQIDLAVLFGSVAKGSDTSSSDIDVLIVSDELTQEAAFALLHEVEARVGRKVNPTIYTPDEFAKRRGNRSPFLEKVLSGKHVTLVGSEDALAAREPRENRQAKGGASRPQ